MDQLIHFVIVFVIAAAAFAIVAYALYWTCERFKLPTPAYWVCGAFLIIIALLFLASQLGVAESTGPLFPVHK
jgi:formate-dependent nitrite reductase membrane component NrfD